MSSTARSEPRALLRHDSLPVPVEIRPVRGAGRLRLRLDETRGVLKLTGPWRMNRRLALEWAAGQRSWVEAQLAAMLPAEPFAPGASVPLEGGEVELAWVEGAPRAPRLEDGRILCGGPIEGFAGRVERFLKRRSLDLLTQETKEMGELAGVAAASVSVGDAGTRWGSCSASGRIRYNWRLVLAPPEARRYVVAHEVAHLVHMNHGAAFKALERRLFGGDPSAARLLLRRIGPRLKRIGWSH